MTRDDIREYHRRRRALAKRMGICLSCNDAKAKEGRTKCHDCLMVNAANIATQRQSRQPFAIAA